MLNAIEGCTLTANVDHGVKFAPMELVKEELKDRNIRLDRRTTDQAARTKLEHILREEEKWQGMSMYCRDKRFTDVAIDTPLERTILDMLHCPMRMHEKVLNVLYQEVLNGKTKNEVNGVKRRAAPKVPLRASAEGVHVAKTCGVGHMRHEVLKGEVMRQRRHDIRGVPVKPEIYQKAHDDVLKHQVTPVLECLTTCIRELGRLGPT
jgi:hypothetical protein